MGLSDEGSVQADVELGQASLPEEPDLESGSRRIEFVGKSNTFPISSGNAVVSLIVVKALNGSCLVGRGVVVRVS